MISFIKRNFHQTVILGLVTSLSACGGGEPLIPISHSAVGGGTPEQTIPPTPKPEETVQPTIVPTPQPPTPLPTAEPTPTPTVAPTPTPTATIVPKPTPTVEPTPTPTVMPTPTVAPTPTPTAEPTPTPTPEPTPTPTLEPTPTPTPPPTDSGIGALLWEDNFDSFNENTWSIDVGDGCNQNLCGWGNAELQWYAENNVSVGDIPGEPGNKALILEAKAESSNGYSFTSGKINSQNKIALQYGLIEIRMNVPKIDTGLWPAAWMLGTSTLPWPRKGEIDMMEMGHAEAEKARQGHAGADSSSYVGSNLIFYAEGACSEGNPTCAASTAYDVDYDKPYAASAPFAERFVIYRTYWTKESIRFTIEDNGTEYDLYESPFQIGDDSDEFRAPFYLLMNLAVGGTFTDALTPSQVTSQFPAPMYVDYVRIYQFNGQGEIFEGNVTKPETGVFGVFTDNAPTTAKLEAGLSSDVFLWDSNSAEGNIAPLEGGNVMTWAYNNPGNWFGGGVQARQARDMSNYVDGSVKFNIKIPADVSFRIGVTDTYGNENWVTFPANETKFGLVRDGDWGEASIPVSELRGKLVAIQSMQYMFAISSNADHLPAAAFEYAIDNIVWEE